jgi:N-acetylneuraminic acid mutarotase
MKHRVFIAAALLLACTAAGSCSGKPMEVMRTARMSAACAVVAGKAYVIGGITEGDYAKEVELLDPATGQWTARAPMPVARAGSPAVTVGDSIYVFGGRDLNGVLARVDIYNPAKDAWTEGPPMLAAVWNSMAAAAGQKVYVMGGISGTGDRREAVRIVQILDLDENTWRYGPELPYGLQGAAVAVYKGQIYVIGGRTGTGQGAQAMAVANVLALDPAAGAWAERSPLPDARTGAQAVVVKDLIIVAGGACAETLTASIDCYDPATDKWGKLFKPGHSKPVSLGTPVTGHCAAVIGNRAYFIGGTTSFGLSGITGLVQEVVVSGSVVQ